LARHHLGDLMPVRCRFGGGFHKEALIVVVEAITGCQMIARYHCGCECATGATQPFSHLVFPVYYFRIGDVSLAVERHLLLPTQF